MVKRCGFVSVCSPDPTSIGDSSSSGDELWADIASVELVFDEEDDCAIDAEAALMSVRDDDMLCAALEANQQDAKFAMAMGTKRQNVEIIIF